MAYIIVEVDDQDADLLAEISAVILSRGLKETSLHRMVANRMGITGDSVLIDHVDRNPLNCRRDNLRPATQMQNQYNREKNRNNTSGFKGVSHVPKFNKKNPYSAYISAGGLRYNLGYHQTAELAARAYDRKAIELHGDFAATNFPKEDYA